MTLRKIVENHLRDSVPDLKKVSGSADLQSVTKSGGLITPSAYVYRERSRATPNNAISHVCQTITETIAVLIVTRNVQGAIVDLDDNETLCDLVRDALLGYLPDNYNTPFEYVGGELVYINNGLQFWRDAYQCKYFIRQG